jgi:phage nucleotide-binding protein
MRFSYSNISTFSNCPYRWFLQYKERLKTIPECNADNALWLGLGLHKGIETGSAELGVKEYRSHFNVLTDEIINYSMQLEYQIPRVIELLPEGGEHEVEIKTDEFVGYIDYVCGDTLYDFKFSNNIDNYLTSPQLSIYKHYLELVRPDIKINHLKYVFVPKINIRQKFKQKPPETIAEFRKRLLEHLEASEIKIIEVNYENDSVTQFLGCCQALKTVEKFPKNETRLCDWCDFKEYCQSNGLTDYMIINNQRGGKEMYKKLWVYGSPFSGKTTLACGSPKHFVLSTDGNAQYITNDFKLISDEVTKNGRITTRKLAWEVLKDEIERLEGGTDYETIVVDLVEDTYEMARLFMYQKLGITHESDDSFRAWDKVRTEYLSTMRRLINLPYNIVLISHEDTSKDITKKNGENITAIKPNINDKVANKLAGMVALVGRTIVDGSNYTLAVKPDEVVFGGGRLGINNVVVPNDWNEVVKLFEKKTEDKK